MTRSLELKLVAMRSIGDVVLVGGAVVEDEMCGQSRDCQ